MPIFLKKMEDGTVEAMGDMGAVKEFGGYDKAVTVEAWRAANYAAHVENGEIVLGASDEVLAEDVRFERDETLKKNVDTINAVRWAMMSTEAREKWKAYRQALLDIPEQSGFPRSVVWPTKPE